MSSETTVTLIGRWSRPPGSLASEARERYRVVSPSTSRRTRSAKRRVRTASLSGVPAARSASIDLRTAGNRSITNRSAAGGFAVDEDAEHVDPADPRGGHDARYS
jgi:hypothetical protein